MLIYNCCACRRQRTIHSLFIPTCELYHHKHCCAAGMRLGNEGGNLSAEHHASLHPVYGVRTMTTIAICEHDTWLATVNLALGMQDLYHGFHPKDDSSIFVFIAIFAAAQLLLSQLPTIRHLRHLNVAAVVCTVAYVIIVSVECIKGGEPVAPCMFSWAGSTCRCPSSSSACPCQTHAAEISAAASERASKVWCVGYSRCPTAGKKMDRSRVSHRLVPEKSAGQYTLQVRGPPFSKEHPLASLTSRHPQWHMACT